MTESRPVIAALQRELAELEGQGLRRDLHALAQTGGHITQDGREILNFSCNDYLDLARDPRVLAAAAQALQDYGTGATASRLMSGHLDLHAKLEARLAAWTGQESALVFGSGFLTNLGVITALARKGDVLFSDKLNHASLIDGMRLSGATSKRYPHKDTAALEKLLQQHANAERKLIVTDSLFSMDGDIAPLTALAELAQRYDALLIVDEAHALGIFGAHGGGLCRMPEAPIPADMVIGGMGKALGGYGGFVACNATIRDILINRARSFIYSTGLPPASVGGVLGALDVLEEEPERGAQLLAKARYLHAKLSGGGIAMPTWESQIVPVPIGENETALQIAHQLRETGILATAVRPPTVPQGTARLRLSVTLAHSEADLDRVSACILTAFRQAGLCAK